ncbi:DUF3455 domain-containing protein [Actinoplanes palleronii]|uniref:DUF3455 domain-containing protein n=1 Tax=Actinoplanes palleronii TaxID=113570 RepID=A0ABQ4BN00_9ACTN|nr:DUF3455 domain-containing protein [Actinoplanes palleronii]GIE71575.1 hypothetical protein Apa02nite_076830 [Actinoplanes palleronii]
MTVSREDFVARTARIAGVFSALALISAALPAGAASAAPAVGTPGAPVVPATLQPPAGTEVHAVLRARGVQIYECKRSMWQPLEPAASLTGTTVNPARKVTAVHFRGPAWVSDQDGSMVQGTDPVTEPATEPGSLPLSLYRATGNRGGGLFGPVTWIQRIDTHGGAAPATSCGGDQPVAVPYRALYRFFTKK